MYFNQIFDPNSWDPKQLLWPNWLNQLQIWSKCSKLFKSNQKVLTKSIFIDFLIEFDFFNLTIYLFNLLIDIKVIFLKLLIKNRSNLVKFNWKWVNFNLILTSTFYRNTILTSDFELDRFWRSHLDILKSELSMIQFWSHNCLSLQEMSLKLAKVDFYHIM